MIYQFFGQIMINPVNLTLLKYLTQEKVSPLQDETGILIVLEGSGCPVSSRSDIVAMVELAGDIRGLLAAYEARLAREVSTEAVARQIAAIEEGYREGIERAAASLAEAKAASQGDGVERLQRIALRRLQERPCLSRVERPHLRRRAPGGVDEIGHVADNEAPFRRVVEGLREKLKHSTIAPYVEVVAEVAGEEKSIVQRYSIE